MSLFFMGIAATVGAWMMYTVIKEASKRYDHGVWLMLRAYVGLVLFLSATTYAIGLFITEYLR